MKDKIFRIKQDIESFVGTEIELRANKGRKKSFVRKGILERTYPSVFIVRFESDQSVMSFTYTDVLTKAVEVTMFTGTEGHMIDVN